MKKIISKISMIILLTFCIFSLLCSNTYVSAIDAFTKADEFINMGSTEGTISDDAMQNMSDTLYNVLLIIGTVAAVIVGAILGIKFMTGSVAEQAKVKESLIAYVAGCVVIFGAFAIWKLVVTILQNSPSA